MTKEEGALVGQAAVDAVSVGQEKTTNDQRLVGVQIILTFTKDSGVQIVNVIKQKR